MDERKNIKNYTKKALKKIKKLHCKEQRYYGRGGDYVIDDELVYPSLPSDEHYRQPQKHLYMQLGGPTWPKLNFCVDKDKLELALVDPECEGWLDYGVIDTYSVEPVCDMKGNPRKEVIKALEYMFGIAEVYSEQIRGNN